MNDMHSQPWLGLSSYEERDSRIFYGRSAELEELFGDIIHNTQTVIYGPSGTGKTSILKAGIFVKARSLNYLPVYVRLNHDGKQSYTLQIINQIKTEVKNSGGEIENIVTPVANEDSSLWEFFHSSVFWSSDNYPLIPMVVVDQFEEIFTLTKDKGIVVRFFDELSDLCDNTMPEYIKEYLNSKMERRVYPDNVNYRLILSLREDFLARLEECSINIPSFRRNRFSLQAINEEQAMEIIIKPSNGLVSEEVAIEIIKKVTNNANFKIDGIPEISVEPSLLSLFCNELNKKRIASHSPTISMDLLNEFGDNIITEYYENTISLISEKSMLFLEKALLTSKGYRDSVALSDALENGVTNEEIDLLQSNRVIHVDEWDGTKRIEFTHDVLCKVAKEKRNKRNVETELQKEKERVKALEKERRSFLNALIYFDFSVISLMVFLSVKTFLNYPYDSLNIYEKFGIVPNILSIIYLFLLRTNTSLLMLKNEKKGLYSSILFILLMLFSNGQGIETQQLENLTNSYLSTKLEDIPAVLITLYYFMFPLLFFIGKLFFNWKSTNDDASWLSIITCSNLIKRYKNIYLLQFIILTSSMIIGLKSNNIYYSLLGIPFIISSLFLILSYRNNIKPRPFLISSFLISLLYTLLVLCQCKTFSFNKIYIYIIIWTLVLIILIRLVKRTTVEELKIKIVRVFLSFIISFFTVSIFSIGYIYFFHSKYAIIRNFNTEYNTQGIYLITDLNGNLGLRDRKGLIVPVEYDSIKDFKLPFIKVCNHKMWGITIDHNAFSNYFGYNDKNNITNSNIRNGNLLDKLDSTDKMYIPCKYKNIEGITPEILILTDVSNKKGVYKDSMIVIPCIYKEIAFINDSIFKSASIEYSAENNSPIEIKITDFNNKVGLFDLNRNMEILSCKYDSINKVRYINSEGISFFIVYQNGKCGLIGGIYRMNPVVFCSYKNIEIQDKAIKLSDFNGKVNFLNLEDFSDKIRKEFKLLCTVENVIEELFNYSNDTIISFDEKIISLSQIINICDQYKYLLKIDDYIDNIYVSTLGNLSWYLLFEKKFSEAEKIAILGFKFDKTKKWIYTNLAHALLFQNKYEDAKKIYLENKDQTYPEDTTKTFKYYFLQDFDELEKHGITHPDIAKIRALLNN